MVNFHRSDPTYPAFSICAFLGFLLPLIPLPWHFQAWNSGTCWYIFWASLSCFNFFINSLVWAGNTLDVAPAWCEISIRILMGASVGVPAASLCINRRLYQIATVKNVVTSASDKRRAVFIDSLICGLFPALFIAAQYIVQGHKYNILEDVGCYPDLYNTVPTYFVSYMWPLVIGVISAIYCVLSVRAFSRRRAAFTGFATAHPALTPSRFLRLTALAMTDLFLTIPLASFLIYLNSTSSPVYPYVSWADTHFDYNRVEELPHIIWKASPKGNIAVEITRWLAPITGFVFFAFFGVAAEARKNYFVLFGRIGHVVRCLVARFSFERPTSGWLASRSQSSAHHLPMPVSFPKAKPSPVDTTLAPYATHGTAGSLASHVTNDLRLKRGMSRTSSLTSFSTPPRSFKDLTEVEKASDESSYRLPALQLQGNDVPLTPLSADSDETAWSPTSERHSMVLEAVSSDTSHQCTLTPASPRAY